MDSAFRKGMADFGLQQINDSRLQTLYYYPDSTDLFPAQVAEIADGISIVVKNAHKTTPSFRYFYMRRGEKQVSSWSLPAKISFL